MRGYREDISPPRLAPKTGARTWGTRLGYGISYTYNGAGRAISLKNSSDPFNYVTAATYAPFGGLATMTMGAKPITISNSFNNRLQPTTLSASTSAATIMSLSYDFHSSTHADNGNVFQIVNNRDNNRTQNFMYDSLNRIQQAYTSGTNWGETFSPLATAPGVAPSTPGIDAWGNLTNRSGVTGKTNYEQLNCPANNKNQLTTCSFGYDTAGNMTSNGSATYTYDAENRLIGAGGTSYIYDGDGRRVEKCTAGTTPGTCTTNPTGTLYWTGPGSDPLAETDLAGNILENYIFFNGQHIARRDASTKAVHYYFSDHLGTHSLITDANGTMPPQQESDYYPYGGEIPVTGSDSNHYKFTGKERDTENGLDNFGPRYNASSFGRFMTPDWSAKPQGVPYAVLGDPQSLNLYTYVGNSPLNRTDPTGHCESGGQKQGFWWCVGHALGINETTEEAAARIATERQWLINNVARNQGQIDYLRNASAATVNGIYQKWDRAIQSAQGPEVFYPTQAFRRDASGNLVLYRGGNFDNVSDYKLDANGNVRAGEGARGPSLFDDPAKIPPRFTEINPVTQEMLPPELVIKQIGKPGHFEIVPREPGMSPG